MEYLLVLTISGSTITAVYLLLRCLLKRKICARYFDLLARAAILYYLVPLPYLKKCYLVVLRRLLPESPVLISKISLSRRNHIVYAEDALHVNIYAGVQMAAAILWILAIGILLAVWVIEYVRLARIAARYADMAMTPECRAFLENLKKQYKIRRRVYLYEAMAGENTITFGFFKPVIICSRATASPEAELLVRHELLHIKRMDVLWKMLMDVARMIHCYNPLVWILHSSFEQVCECSCDEIVMQERTDVEVKEYLAPDDRGGAGKGRRGSLLAVEVRLWRQYTKDEGKDGKFDEKEEMEPCCGCSVGGGADFCKLYDGVCV